MGTSPSTGQSFYSGDWQTIQEICRVLNIGDGKMSQITREMVERYQERVDRMIDGLLSGLYLTPFIAKKMTQPNGTVVTAYPGELTNAALYWTAGLLLANEFQGLDPNANEAAVGYQETAKREIFALRRPTNWLRGQQRRSKVSRTMPATMQPPAQSEPDF